MQALRYRRKLGVNHDNFPSSVTPGFQSNWLQIPGVLRKPTVVKSGMFLVF